MINKLLQLGNNLKTIVWRLCKLLQRRDYFQNIVSIKLSVKTIHYNLIYLFVNACLPMSALLYISNTNTDSHIQHTSDARLKRILQMQRLLRAVDQSNSLIVGSVVTKYPTETRSKLLISNQLVESLVVPCTLIYTHLSRR